MAAEDGWTEFGQQVSLTQRIREVLDAYPDGSTIVKEMVQNADDAGATIVRVCYDQRQHGTGALAFPKSSEYQGPAILFYNNAAFKDKDFVSIQHIGDSEKKKDANRALTGRFGVGFNSVYHLTDLPAFVSSSKIVFFDPHCKVLPGISVANPGCSLDFVAKPLQTAHMDQFEPFKMFGNTFKSRFEGTLFRLPLRTEEQARTSRISNLPYTPESVQRLFTQFAEEAPSMLLFLKSVHTIEWYTIPEGATEPVLNYRTALAGVTPALQTKRNFLASVPRDLRALRERSVSYQLAVETTTADGGAPVREDWLVEQCVGGGRSLELALSPETERRGMKVTPWGGVAARLNSVTEWVGRAFCFLPLPVKNSLPVHVNGYFELTLNRRDIWYGAGDGEHKSQWNQALLDDVVAEAYAALLVRATNLLTPAQLLALLPGRGLPEPWNVVATGVYVRLLQLAVLRPDMAESGWMKPVDVLFSEVTHAAGETINGLLGRLHVPVVTLPPFVRESLTEAAKRRSGTKLQSVTPAATREILRQQALPIVARNLPPPDVPQVLEYCLESLAADEMIAGLPLLMCADNELREFETAEGRPIYLASADECALLSRQQMRLIDADALSANTRRLLTTTLQAKTNVRSLDHNAFGELARDYLPAAWRKGGAAVTNWSGERTGNDTVSPEWIARLWKYMVDKRIPVAVLKNLPLLPTTSLSLVPVREEGTRLVDGKNIEAEAWAAMEAIGVRQLDLSLLPALTPQMAAFVRMGNPAGVLDAIRECMTGTTAEAVAGKLPAAARRALLGFFAEARWAGREGLISAQQKRLQRELPLYEHYSQQATEADSLALFGPLGNESLPPANIHPSLLNEAFLKAGDPRGALHTFFERSGVPVMTHCVFLLKYVFPLVPQIDGAVLNETMLNALAALQTLTTEIPDFPQLMSEVAFVPVAAGGRRRPIEVYDPKMGEMEGLLDRATCFPAPPFDSAAVLSGLVKVGLQTALTPSGMLRIARDIEAQADADGPHAAARGRQLLGYIDTQLARDQLFVKTSLWKRLTTTKPTVAEETTAFFQELSHIAFLPVWTQPREPHMPWPATPMHVAAARVVALPEDAWLVSYSRRILDVPMRSVEIAKQFDWGRPASTAELVAQLLQFSAHYEAGDMLNQLMAAKVPALYRALAGGVTRDADRAALREALQGKPWVWVGYGFVAPEIAAFNSVTDLRPYLHVVPADMAGFRLFMLPLGVRDAFGVTDYAHVLGCLARDHQNAVLTQDRLSLALTLVQRVAEAPLAKDTTLFVPDVGGILCPANELVHNDVPWRRPPQASNYRFVHATISSAVAKQLGVKSLRMLLLTSTSDVMDLGVANAELFGQTETLTSRLRNLVELYPDGQGVLLELLQNADDARAGSVTFMLDMRTHGSTSLLSPEMAAWQGPALYVMNDAQFSQRDFVNIARIGQASKLDNLITTGRFGLGFNAVYQLTDLPSFVSGDYLVVFDPHSRFLPGSVPGLKIDFVSSELLQQFPDQFEPYVTLGCDMTTSFKGTLFRFPLRQAAMAARSEIRTAPYSPEMVMELFGAFREGVDRSLLFLKNVTEVRVLVRTEEDPTPRSLFAVRREWRGEGNPRAVGEFVAGTVDKPISCDQFYDRLSAALKRPQDGLPRAVNNVLVHATDATGGESTHEWLVSNTLGGGASAQLALSPEGRKMRFVPWAGAAARLNSQAELEGRAFCFLPLPLRTGLPVHLNGYFELSANRRDLWSGDALAGKDKLRSDWNAALLTDAVTSAWVRLLTAAAATVPPEAFYALLPGARLAEPWASVAREVYARMLNLPLMPSLRGTRIAPINGRLALSQHPAAEVVNRLLSDGGCELYNAPPHVREGLAAAPHGDKQFAVVSPEFVRDIFRTKHGRTARDAMPAGIAQTVGAYCFEGAQSGHPETLIGVPLVDGVSVGPPTARPVYLADDEACWLLRSCREMLVPLSQIAPAVAARLKEADIDAGTNVHVLQAPGLATVLASVIPQAWRGVPVVRGWVGAVPEGPLREVLTPEWLHRLWAYIGAQNVPLAPLIGLPLLPSSTGDLHVLQKRSVLVRVMERAPSVFEALGVGSLDTAVTGELPQLVEHVPLATPVVVVDALMSALLPPQANPTPEFMTKRLSMVSAEDRRAMVAFLVGADFERVEFTPPQQQFLRALPIYEVYNAPTPELAFASVLRECYLAPRETPAALLDTRFLVRGYPPVKQGGEPVDVERFLMKLGVVALSLAEMYAKCFFPRVSVLDPAVRDEAGLSLLASLGQLVKGDPHFASRVAAAEFVPTPSGTLRAPRDLYHPNLGDMQGLIDVATTVPAPVFCTPIALTGLSLAGMHTTLDANTLLSLARGVEATAAKDPVKAGLMGQVLLRQLDAAGAVLGELPALARDDFFRELRTVAWMPVQPAPYARYIPWPSGVIPTVVTPARARPAADEALVSATMYVTDGVINSRQVMEGLSYTAPPAASVLAAQVEAYATMPAPTVPDERRTQFLNENMPRLYGALSEAMMTSGQLPEAKALNRLPCVWVNGSFVPPSRVACESAINCPPYLYALDDALRPGVPFLTNVGVRSAFSADDYASMLDRMAADARDAPLPEAHLAAALAASDAIASGTVGALGRGRVPLLPDAKGVLRPAATLHFNDAPWIAASSPIFARDDIHMAHPALDKQRAEALGTKSLCALLLVDKQSSKTLACPNLNDLRPVVAKMDNDNAALFDFIEIADLNHAQGISFTLDNRQHPAVSVVQPALASLQGPALVVSIEGMTLDENGACALLAGAGDYRFSRGLMSAFYFSDVVFVLSRDKLLIFDPSGQYLVENLDAISAVPQPMAKAFNFTQANLVTQFPDQFAAYDVFGFDRTRPYNGVLIRMPLRNAADLTLPNTMIKAIDRNRIQQHVLALQQYAGGCLCFASNLNEFHIDEVEGGDNVSVKTRFRAIADPQSAAQHIGYNALMQDQTWRDYRIFTRFTPLTNSRVINITIAQPMDGTAHIDRYVVHSVLGAGRSRDMGRADPTKRRFPLAGVAVHVTRDDAPAPPATGALFVGPCLTGSAGGWDAAATGLPVHISGLFELASHPPLAYRAVARDGMGGPAADSSAWNESLMACVVDAYVDAIGAAQQMVPVLLDDYRIWPNLMKRQPPAPGIMRDMNARVLESLAKLPYFRIGAAGALAPLGRGYLPPAALPADALEWLSVVFNVYFMPGALGEAFAETIPTYSCLTPAKVRENLSVRQPRPNSVIELMRMGMPAGGPVVGAPAGRERTASVATKPAPRSGSVSTPPPASSSPPKSAAATPPTSAAAAPTGAAAVAVVAVEARPAPAATAEATAIRLINALVDFCALEPGAPARSMTGVPLLPLASGRLVAYPAESGRKYLVASRQEQTIIPNMDDLFVHPDFSCQALRQGILPNLETFSPATLAGQLPNILPAGFRGAASVLWTPGEQGHPTDAWLRAVLEFIIPGKTQLQEVRAKLAPFENFTLIPLVGSRLASPRIWSAICALQASDHGPVSAALTAVGLCILDPAYEYHLPMECLPNMETEHAEFVRGLVTTLSQAAQQNMLVPELPPLDLDNPHPHPGLVLSGFFAEELRRGRIAATDQRVLAALPIYETVGERAGQQINGPFRRASETMRTFEPVGAGQFLPPTGYVVYRPELLPLYTAAGVRTMNQTEIMSTVLAAFADKNPSRPVPEGLLLYLRDQFERIRSAELVDRARLARIVPSNDGLMLRPASELLDPTVPLLARAFAGTRGIGMFPAPDYCTSEWLDFLRAMGLSTTMSRVNFVKIAKQVASAKATPDTLELGDQLILYFKEHPNLFSTEFALSMAAVRFIPLPVPGRVGERKRYAFNEVAVSSLWPLVWNVLPCLPADLMPQTVMWRELGLISTASAAQVVANLKACPPDLLDHWEFTRSPTSTFQEILTYLRDKVPQAEWSKLRGMPLIPCGGALVPSHRLYLTLDRDLAPFCYAVPREFGQFDALLREIGVRERPGKTDLTQLLNELKNEFKGAPLNPSELNRVLSLLALLMGDATRDPQGANAAVAVVPDAQAVLVPVTQCCYNDNAWLARRIRLKGVRYVHPAVPRELWVAMGRPLLSQLVVEALEPSADLSELTNERVTQCNTMLHTREFADSIAAICEAYAGVQWNAPAEGSSPSFTETLASLRVVQVAEIPVRYIFNGRDNVTVGRQTVLLHEDRATRTIYVGALPPGVRLADVLSRGLIAFISRVRPRCANLLHPLELAPLIEASAPDRLAAVMDSLGLRGQSDPAAKRGVPGNALLSDDTALMQLAPLRRFVPGEIVAVPAPNTTGADALIYAIVVEAGADETLRRVTVRIGATETIQVLSSSVYTFKTNLHRDARAEAAAEQEGVRGADELEASLVPDVPQAGPSRGAGAGAAAVGAAAGKAAAATAVSRTEVLSAVRELLSSVGLPLSLERERLVDQNRVLAEERDAVAAELEKMKNALAERERRIETQSQALQCPICMSERADNVSVPCGHRFCGVCAAAMVGTPCALCRKNVREVVRVYDE